MRRGGTDGVTPLLPGPEPPELGAPPGPPSGPPDSGDDSAPPSGEQTLRHLLHPFKLLQNSTEGLKFSDQTCRKRTSGGPRARTYGTATVGGAWNTEVISWKQRVTTCSRDAAVTARTASAGYHGNRMSCSPTQLRSHQRPLGAAD